MTNSCQQLEKGANTQHKIYDKFLGPRTTWSGMMDLSAKCVLVATFVIGILALTGHFPSSVFFHTTLGLGLGYAALRCLGGRWCKGSYDLLLIGAFTAPLIACGSLGLSGTLSYAQVGGALIVTPLAYTALVVQLMVAVRCLKSLAPESNPHLKP